MNCRAAVASLSETIDGEFIACDDWKQCLDGADITIDRSSLTRDQPLFPLSALAPGTTLITYGYRSSLPLVTASRIDRLVIDRWVDDQNGAMCPLVAAGAITENRVDATISGVIAGNQIGRQTDEQSLVF